MLANIDSVVTEFVVKVMNKFFGAAVAWNPTAGTQENDLNRLIQRGLNTALIIAGVLAVAYLIYSGIRYIMSGGDASKAKEAQQGITNAIIGLVVALVAFVVVQFVFQAIGANIQTDVSGGF